MGGALGFFFASCARCWPFLTSPSFFFPLCFALYPLPFQQCKSEIDKLEVKNAAMKAKQVREKAQLKSKEDMGGSLHKVDFDQLKIENTRYAEVMNERVRELLDLKVVVGSTNNKLNALKVRRPAGKGASCGEGARREQHKRERQRARDDRSPGQ